MALIAARDRKKHSGVHGVVFSPRTPQCFYINAGSEAPVRRLLQETGDAKLVKCPEMHVALAEHTSYQVALGQWFIFASVDALGVEYLALGLSKGFNRAEGVVTAYTLPNSGKDLMLFLGGNRGRYLKGHHTDPIESGDDVFWSDTRTGNTLHFQHGLQVVCLSIHQTAVPTKAPPSMLVKLVLGALSIKNPSLVDAATRDLERFTRHDMITGMRCKIIRGPFGGVVGRVESVGVGVKSGEIKVWLRWGGSERLVPIPASFLTTSFEVGDEVEGNGEDGSRVRGWITGLCSATRVYVTGYGTVRCAVCRH